MLVLIRRLGLRSYFNSSKTMISEYLVQYEMDMWTNSGKADFQAMLNYF